MSADDILSRFAGFVGRDWQKFQDFKAAERVAALSCMSPQVTCEEFIEMYTAFEGEARALPQAALEDERRIERLVQLSRVFARLAGGQGS